MKLSRWKRIGVVAALGVLAFVGLGAWAISSPVGSSPDDDYHLASIWCAWGDREGLCAPGENPGERTVTQEFQLSSMCFAFKPEQSADCGYDANGAVSTHRGNFTGNYPPLFYATMGVFASPDVAASTVVMRLFNAGLFVGAVTAVVLLLRRGQRGPILWGAAITMIPLGMFIVPSVNPSSWAVLAGLTVWIAVTGYFTAAERTKRIALGSLAVLFAVLGAGARGDAAAYVALAAVIGAILTFRKDRDWLKLAILPLAIIVIGAIFFLSTGQSTSYASTGVIQGVEDLQVADPGAVASAGSGLGESLRLLFENLMLLPGLWAGVLGSWKLGWLDTPMYDTVWVATIGAFSAIVFWGLRAMGARKALVLGLVLLALVVVPLYILYGLHARVGEEVQPRYILPLIVMFAGVALYGAVRDDLGLGKVQALIVLFGLAVANSLALHMNMRRYITGIDFRGASLNAHIEWWWPIPIAPMAVWFVGSAAFALLLFGLYLLLFTGAGRRLMPQEEAVLDAPDSAESGDAVEAGEVLVAEGAGTRDATGEPEEAAR